MNLVVVGELAKWPALRDWGPQRVADLARWRQRVAVLEVAGAAAAIGTFPLRTEPGWRHLRVVTWGRRSVMAWDCGEHARRLSLSPAARRLSVVPAECGRERVHG